MNSAEIIERLADLYLEIGSAGRSETPRVDAWDAVDSMCRLPELGAALTVVLLQRAASPEQIAYVAAGPLEDVLGRAEPRDLAILEAAIDTTPNLVRALRAANTEEGTSGARWAKALLGRPSA